MGSGDAHGSFDLEDQKDKDKALLERLNVKCIFDLMVESHKKVYGVRVTSSEKADRVRYSSCSIIPVPYPGCEFFKDFKENGRSGCEIVYNWDSEMVNSHMVPDPAMRLLDICWKDYRDWDLVTLTKNYLKGIYSCLETQNKGILVHCISGWDRTPLFISLLRLSLWADGSIHQSLNEEEMLYFTLAYDWMLFTHQLSNRIMKQEEILYFCFYFLEFIEEFDELKEPPVADEVFQSFVAQEEFKSKDDVCFFYHFLL